MAEIEPDRESPSESLPTGQLGRPERRRHPRRGIRDMQLIQPVRGEVVNLGAGGLGLCTWDSLAVNKEYWFTFGTGPARVRVRGRVVWCRLRATRDLHDWDPRYHAGVQFTESP